MRCQGEDFIRKVLQNILGITAKSEKFQKFQHLALETLMANILIRFKKLIWKPRCKQVILWEKREGQFKSTYKDLQIGKVDQLQKSVSLVKKSMNTFTGLKLKISFIEYL
ncbi:hypothetical protein RhiirB3_430049 [Rhizophagus irregularis]|nr:hypothetical protein RhiirB3_430049 [Rhizophagus irregularis]